MRIFDLSVPLQEDSEPFGMTIDRFRHEDTARTMAERFGATPEDMDGYGSANERLSITPHTGTHVDSPYHYYPTTNNGERSPRIDELPLEWFIAPGVVLDLRHKEPGSLVTPDDLQQALDKISYSLQPGDIVMLQTGADKLWGKPAVEGKTYPPPFPEAGIEYFVAGCGPGRETTLWLIEQEIRVMGTDAWGWDRPFWAMRQEFEQTGNASVLWEAHRAGKERAYCQIEKLANLDQLPQPYGFVVSALPIKIARGSGAWTRAVAIFDD